MAHNFLTCGRRVLGIALQDLKGLVGKIEGVVEDIRERSRDVRERIEQKMGDAGAQLGELLDHMDVNAMNVPCEECANAQPDAPAPGPETVGPTDDVDEGDDDAFAPKTDSELELSDDGRLTAELHNALLDDTLAAGNDVYDSAMAQAADDASSDAALEADDESLA